LDYKKKQLVEFLNSRRVSKHLTLTRCTTRM
jgi:hypothetical protein